MKFIKTFIYILLILSAVEVSAVELCKPLNTDIEKDELGGVRSERLEQFVSRASEIFPETGWSLFQRTSEKNVSVCSKIAIIPKSMAFVSVNRFGHQTQGFFRAIEREKRNVMDFYANLKNLEKRIAVTDYEYNKLAYLAVGILGAESSAGKSHYYALEYVLSQSQAIENIAVCLSNMTWKSCTQQARTSRGLTQIREVPLISNLYGVTRDNLSDPYLAGVATMGFLIETYREYKQKLVNQDYLYVALDQLGQEYNKKIEQHEFHMFLTYMYRGDDDEFGAGTAKPHKNCYYKRVQKFQEYIDMYIHHDKDCSESEGSILAKAN